MRLSLRKALKQYRFSTAVLTPILSMQQMNMVQKQELSK